MIGGGQQAVLETVADLLESALVEGATTVSGAARSPGDFFGGFVDKSKAQKFAEQKQRDKEILGDYIKVSEGTKEIQNALLTPVKSAAKEGWDQFKQRNPEFSYMLEQYISDPRVMHTLTASELMAPSLIKGLATRTPMNPNSFTGNQIGAIGPVKERKHSKLLGPQEQKPLERRLTTPTGKPVKEPPTIEKMFTDENIERIKGLAQKGMKAEGEKWYWTGGLLDEFVKELGPEQGKKRFDTFMQLGAALSPRSKVDQELKRASILHQRQMQGQPIAPLTPEMFPKGYGHMATRTAHAPAVGRIAETGLVGDPTVQPKVTSYAANKSGNYQPVTVDTHNMKIISGQDKSPTMTEYPFMEQRQAQIAQSMGLDPAEFQSALWVGAGDITGVANTQNLTSAINERIKATAKALDIPEEEAMKRFIRGDEYLRAMVGAVGAGILGSEFTGEENGSL
jgi:hypothetical protein